MIDRELLGKIKGNTDKNEASFTDVPPEWAEAEQKDHRKKGTGYLHFLARCLKFFAIGTIALLFLLIVIGLILPDMPDEQTAPAARIKNEPARMQENATKRTDQRPIQRTDYKAEIEFFVIDRCYKKLVREIRPDLSSPNFDQIEKMKSVMQRDVQNTIRQLLPEVRGKPRKERLTVYESAMGKCRLPY